jgi:hypothetical protein
MSYVAGYGEKPGEKKFWGNGDGRFLYPPRRKPGPEQPASLEGPISSCRWENLRDGMEDYEYFWLLKQAIGRAGKNSQSKLIDEARGLLRVPEIISKDLKQFNPDPRLVLEHRARLAEMIERLTR